MRNYLESGDFRSADVRKVGENLYRARLDRSNRLLFAMHRHGGETFILVLEFIRQHAYDKSRFLRRGARILDEHVPEVFDIPEDEPEELAYINPNSPRFHLLNKVISFDDEQEDLYATEAPFIVVGSAGSGKTALTLERLKRATGSALYVTRSRYLAGSSRDQYYAKGYRNDEQDVAFLSFDEFLASIRVPPGSPVTFRDFSAWFAGHRQASGVKDAYQLFEEFAGVITGNSAGAAYLSQDDYLSLGVRQSIFSESERPAVYSMFIKYLEFLDRSGLFDPNILSQEYLPLATQDYDFIVVDEVQDVTTVQLELILSTLREPDQFILCGDSNQIVHPNFFSWAKLKTLFHTRDAIPEPARLIRQLTRNYRNSPEVTELANRVLRLKTARFGSVDRESTFLVESTGSESGTVLLLSSSEELTRDLDERTHLSTRFAVIVMNADQRARARALFRTPLVFTVQEAKGLEYDSIILFDFASGSEERYRAITDGVDAAEVAGGELRYARTRDKSDRSLEIYKFQINALYVAVTRALRNVYLLESRPDQTLFGLLGLSEHTGTLDLEAADSSLESWRDEAQRLELQGKAEQAEEIRTHILGIRPVPWQVLTGGALAKLEDDALVQGDRKAKLLLFEYALVHNNYRMLADLARSGFKPALQPDKGISTMKQTHFYAYDVRRTDLMVRDLEKYGVDHRNQFNQTPLMSASRLGGVQHVRELIERGANPELLDNSGQNAFHMLLQQAAHDPESAQERLEELYGLLAPRSTVLQVNGRLVKLDRDSPEFLLFNIMYAAFHEVMSRGMLGNKAFQSMDFVDLLEVMPDDFVPEYRRKRQYVSSILARNERDRDDRYNRRLFLRLSHGNYVINPAVSLRVGDEWKPVYDLIVLDNLTYRPRRWERIATDNVLAHISDSALMVLKKKLLDAMPSEEATADED